MKRLSLIFSALLVLSMVLSACAPATPTPAAEMPTEAPTAAPTEAPTEAPAVTPTEAPTEAAPATAASLPRKETLYFNGFQWGPVVCWNPYSSSCNNAMAISQGDNARVTMFETPYLYNMLDGKQYPCWLMAITSGTKTRTELTFKIKKAATGATARR
jgi:peptide/nickel transport system substrate-binding protein